MSKVRPDTLSKARELSLAGLLGALGLLLPIGFHALGWGGKIFLPMHLPILVGGFLLNASIAGSLGLIVPLLSAVLTGMPPLAPPVAPLMAIELLIKGSVASFAYRRLRLPLAAALLLALISDWLVLALAAFGLAEFFRIEDSPLIYVGGAIALSWPGTVLQAAIAPLAVRVIEQRVPRLAEARRRR